MCTYILYPLAIWLLAKVFPFRVHREEITPNVSIIIPAYNEVKHIERKIENTLALEYPKDKVEILVGLDGCTDETPHLIKKFAVRGVKALNFETNRGKTAVQNDLVSRSTGEILIFTDAACFLDVDAICKVTQAFADTRVGCVAGRLRFVDTEANLTTQSQGVYWCYESKLRELESRLGSLIGVDGPLYAVRRGCYVPISNSLISDLMIPLFILAQGKKVVLEADAVVDEDPTYRPENEFNTRRRTTLRGLTALSAHRMLLNPFRYPLLAFQILFHKFLRWFVGPLVIVNGLACLALSTHWFFTIVLVAYICFLLSAILGWAGAFLGLKSRVLTIPYYFTLVNAAATAGILDFFRKQQVVSWITIRD